MFSQYWEYAGYDIGRDGTPTPAGDLRWFRSAAKPTGDAQQMETCPRCGGEGLEVLSESNDQYDRTTQSYDTCRLCGGEGVVWLEFDPESP